MMKYTTTLMILALTASCTERNDSPPVQQKDEEISIATWNVHNLFDTECDSGACESTDYERQYDPAKYQNQIYAIASGIRTFNSDIVMLQEIEKEQGLWDIMAELPQYPYGVFGETGRVAGLDVGVISKWPITKTAMHRNNHVFTLENGEEKLIARELIEATISLPTGDEITVFVTHFVSKVTDPEGERRENEARIVHDIIAQKESENPNVNIAFGGDLNDEPDSVPLSLLTEGGVLYNSTEGMHHDLITTWNLEAAFDHILHNANLKAHHVASHRECTGAVGHLNPSDHCAMVSVYRFRPKTANNREQ